MLKQQSALRKISQLIALGLVFTLSACGQRGPLVAPDSSINQPAEQVQEIDPATGEPIASQEIQKGQTGTRIPDRDLFLDRLL